MDNNFMKLRTTAFGGFNKQDVISYIERIKNDAYEEKNRLQKQLKEMTDKIGELESQIDSFDKEKDMLVKKIGELSVSGEGKNETAEEINEATNHLKSVADELCESLRDFMQRISENCCSVVIEGVGEEGEEEFDGEKLMAELEAEIYAKLGVEEGNASEACEAEAEEEQDTVMSILSSLGAFSTEEKSDNIKENEKAEDSTVNSILGSLSFLK